MLDDIEIRMKGGRWLTPAERVKFVADNMASIMIPMLKERGLVLRDKINKHEIRLVDLMNVRMANPKDASHSKALYQYFTASLTQSNPSVPAVEIGTLGAELTQALLDALEHEGYYIVKKTEEK